MDADDAMTADPVEPGVRPALDGGAPAISRMLIRSVAPRLLRDILGPTLAFYGGWKLTGSLALGVVLGTAFSLLAYRYERRHGRPGAITRFVLGFVVLQAIIGLATGSAKAYLVQPSILGSVNGLLWLGSVAVGRPLAAVFASEIFPIDDETRASDEFRSVFRHVSLVLGAFFLVFATAQLVVLLSIGVDAFVGVRVLDAAGILGVIVYSVRYAVDRLGDRIVMTQPGFGTAPP